MKPVAITLGDATGIGPEIIVKSFVDDALMASCPAVVVGDLPAVRRAAERWAPNLLVRRIHSISEAKHQAGTIEVLEAGALSAVLAEGQIDARAGRAAFEAIEFAAGLALRGEVAGLCTAPIHKEALAAAGVPYPGHTEMLAALSGTNDFAMLLMNEHLRTMLVTVHCALREAIGLLSIDLELRIIRLAHRTLQGFGIGVPRIAVAGLNPHAGEGGLFGGEDRDILAPAVARARAEGIDASGPHPGDTVFMQAMRGRYDLVVAQYHDQGLIPVKLMGVEHGVNVTAGLPFVRTSPDHGTAFDIAGQGLADPSSLKTALRAAHRLAQASAAHNFAANTST